jgi:trimeric autotransporter adhesin
MRWDMDLASKGGAPAGTTTAIPLLLLFSLTIASTGCGGGSSATTLAPPKTKTLTTISISPAAPTVALGESKQLTATGVFSDASKQDMTKTVIWSTTEPSVASISLSGLALGKLIGSAKVTATSDSVTATDTLAVGPAVVVSIAVSPESFSIPKGVTQQLSAVATFSDGSQKDVTHSATWSVAPTGIAAVNASGILTGQEVGSATVTADLASVKGSDTLTVSSAVMVSIAVSPQNLSVPKGKAQQLAAVATYSDGSQKSMTESATWSAVPTGIVTVSPTGLVTAEAAGSATITASSASVQGNDPLTVTPAILVSITVAPAKPSIMLGTTQQFTAAGLFSDGTTKNLTNSTAWSSANASTASISPTGMAAAESVGSTIISATSVNVSGSATLAVEPQLLVTYFSQANNAATKLDGTVYVTNVGMTDSSLCAMVYVFDTQQEMTECCACSTSPDDLRTLSINHDLTSQPATGAVPAAGVIEIVSASNQAACNASSSLPGGELSAWSTHIQLTGTSTFTLTEAPFEVVPLTPTHASVLQSQCGFLMTESHGICTCGAGD